MSKISFNYEVGKQLKIERKRAGYTLKNVEYILESYPEPISSATLSRMERGDVSADLYTINILAKVYDLDIHTFLQTINDNARLML